MTKYFCDVCTKEITEKNQCAGGQVACDSRLGTEIKARGKRLRVEIMTALDGAFNAGVFCKYCVLDALYRLDDREKGK